MTTNKTKEGQLLAFALEAIFLRAIKQDWVNQPIVTDPSTAMLQAERSKEQIRKDWCELMSKTDKDVVAELAIQYMQGRTEKVLLRIIQCVFSGQKPDDIFDFIEKKLKLHLGDDFKL